MGRVADGFCSNRLPGLWVPAFAGTTVEDMARWPRPSLRAERSNPSGRIRKHGLLRRFAPRNDVDTCLRDLAACWTRGLPSNFHPLQSEGAGKTGGALHPRSRVQDWVKKRTRAYRFSGGSPAFPAQWFYGL